MIMCGITGFFNFDRANKASLEQLNTMSKSISHRGPDGDGYFIYNNIALANRRLAIIDLITGDQPMKSIDNNFVIVYNGEIYNYKQLKEELIQHGYSFRTNSDTEVILVAYQHWGKDCLRRLNGMWAFAIWDKKRKELFLSRDRFGIKPLYYFKDSKKIAFSSEIKTFYSIINIQYDYNELWDMLVFGPKAGGKTHIKNIYEMKPGSFIVASSEKFIQEEYYSLEETLVEQNKKYDIEELDFLIDDSIRKRLISDVPIGTLNSGGLDSSLISAIASRHLNNNLNTFSIAPMSKDGTVLPGDESVFVEMLTNSINSNHITIRYFEEDFFDYLESSVFYHDGILYHSCSIPTSIMSEKIKNDFNTTVILSGDGADEMIMGYSFNRFAHLYNYLNMFPLGKYITKKITSKIFRKFDDSFNLIKNYSFFLKLAIFHNCHLKSEIASRLLGLKGEISEDRLNLIDKARYLSEINKMVFYDQKCYLAGSLQRVDRMSMEWGVEVRVPFLDHRIVNVINSIEYKLKSGLLEKNSKRILKKVAINHIIPDIIKRKKIGFASPIEVFKNDMINRMKIKYGNFLVPDIDFKDLSVYDVFIIYNYYIMSEQLKIINCKD